MQTSVWFPDDPARKALIQRWAIALVRCAMDHVREDCDLEPHLKVHCSDLELCCGKGSRKRGTCDKPTVTLRWARTVYVQRLLLEGEETALMAAEHRPRALLWEGLQTVQHT